jgi:ABC-type Zn uptake system ZnuABC Zn-binding protein ZnuA
MQRKRLPNKVRQTWALTALSLVISLSGCNSAQTKQPTARTPSALAVHGTTNASSTSNSVAVGDHPLVVTTNTVVCGLTRKIAGNTVNLKCLMAMGAADHQYQPKPEDSKAIEQAKLILYSRYNFEPSLSQLIQTSSNPAPKIAVDELTIPNQPQLAANGKTVSSPQTLPTMHDGITMAEAINKSLSQLKPERAAVYRANAQKLTNELTQINSWSQPEIATLGAAQQHLISAHELLAYLNPSPWPNINEQARLARVPILMYHDILPKKQVFFDVTPEELEQHLRLLKENGITPISLDQLVTHLQTGLPLPSKPILLTFDDGYGGHYQYVYPFLKKYNYPAVFSIYTANVGKNTGRTHVTWDQLRQMAADPLVTIASHSVTHPLDLRPLSDNQLVIEVMVSKRILESHLGIPIRYFTYPSGKYDERVENLIHQAGYEAALTMSNSETRFAGQSKSLLAINRLGQSKLQYAIAQAWGGPLLQFGHGVVIKVQ